jgi:uncharacterized protein (TIGR02147 family)
MKSLFEYESYRSFLGDWFQDMKEKRRTFSYRGFARKAGFSSCGFCHQVITGERNLTPEAVDKMISGLGIAGKKAQYFQALVHFEQARTPAEKQKAFTEMNLLRKDSAFFRMNRTHLRYFEHWWYPVLRNLVAYAPWGNDFELLANLVEPPISAAQARQGLVVLQELDMVEQDRRGHWTLTSTLVSSADVPALVKSQTRQEVLQLGLEALDRFPSNQRHATYYTLALRASTYPRIVELIEELNAHASALASEDEQVDRIYELAVMLYPLSKQLGTNT